MEESYPLELQVTMTFEDAGAATRFTLLHQGMPAETIELCRTGWTESFDKLEALLAADSVSV